MNKLVLILLLVPLFITGCAGGPITISSFGQQPSIISFNAEPSSISAGESSDLSWNVSGATTISIDQGIGNVALTGTRAVAPVSTTVYTLTASSSAGSTMATTQVVVSGTSSSSSSSIPTPTPTSWPIVNYFMANPSVIVAGGSTTLGWDVSNATSVVIDNGVGSVGSSGTTVVSPAASTNYTLTATNAVGSYYMTIAVLVTGAAPAGMPDLIIQDIVRSGDTITYTITNQGDAAAGPSTSTLLVDSATVANDSVGSLIPGESKTETFTGYTYTCTLPSDTLTVKADTGGAVVESSEVNNSYSESWACLLLIQPVVPVFTLKPDLVITDIWIDGHTIRYRIKNEGTGASSVGYSRLYIDGDVKGNDLNVPVIAAGDSLPRSFTYNFDCALPILKEVKVTADRGDTSTESDETNNSRTENLVCP
jgi:CARDB